MNKSDVVILAGGFGTRLRSVIGEDTPKPMALVDGIPLIQSQIQLCKRYGLKRILILVHHLSEKIIDFFKDGSSFGVNIQYFKEEHPRGTAGAIRDASEYLNDEFLVIYGDTYLDVDLTKFKNAKAKSDAVLTLCHPNSHPFDSDLLELNSRGQVKRVFRPSISGDELYDNIVNAALYIINKDIFINLVPEHGSFDISSQLFPILIQNNIRIQAYKSVEYIKDMGTPERYNEVCNAVKDGIPSMMSTLEKRKCVFLDRDGVINKDVGHLNQIDDFILLPRVGEAIRNLNRSGFLVICVTNQPVIARGDLTISDLDKIHKKMQVLLGQEGAYLDDIFFCPHHPDTGFKGEIAALKIKCNCRKPSPGMLHQSELKHSINLSNSWMIGDHIRDIEAGKNAGVSTIFVGNDFPAEDFHSLQPDFITPSLIDAVDTILN